MVLLLRSLIINDISDDQQLMGQVFAAMPPQFYMQLVYEAPLSFTLKFLNLSGTKYIVFSSEKRHYVYI